MSNSGIAQSLFVLIDSLTKDTVTTITYDVLSKHAGVITDIRELGDENYRSEVVVFEPALQVIVTPEILKELVPKLDLSVTIVYQDEDRVKGFEGLANLVKADYSDINWNFVYAVINKDLAILESYQESKKVIDGFKAFRDKVPVDLHDYLNRFRGSYLTLMGKVQEVLEANSHLKDVVEIQRQTGTQTAKGLVELRKLLDQAQDKCNAYEALLSEGYDTTFGGFYPERPRILYIKKISHVSGIDTLLSILYTVITKQYKSSCKILKLVDSSCALDMRYVPNSYISLSETYHTADALQNDFVCKLGAYNMLLDTLLLNRSGLDFFIIHDMRGTLKPAIDTSLVDLYINEVSSDYAILGEYQNTLSDLQQSDFPWSFIECQKYTGSQVTKLVNHPTVSAILDSIL